MEKENIDTYKLLSSFDKLRCSLTTKDDKCINQYSTAARESYK